MTVLYDVVAVNRRTYKVRLLAEGKSSTDAEAIVQMAVMRRGVEEEIFSLALTGDFHDGDDWKSEEPPKC